MKADRQPRALANVTARGRTCSIVDRAAGRSGPFLCRGAAAPPISLIPAENVLSCLEAGNLMTTLVKSGRREFTLRRGLVTPRRVWWVADRLPPMTIGRGRRIVAATDEPLTSFTVERRHLPTTQPTPASPAYPSTALSGGEAATVLAASRREHREGTGHALPDPIAEEGGTTRRRKAQ